MYISENYGQGKNDEKHAQNMLKQFQKEGEEGDDKTEEAKLQAEKEQWEDVGGIEEMLKEQNEQNNVSQVYKLFNLICK